MSNYRIIYSDELCHYGVLGMKWGVRRYQNPDGSYTAAGRKHYGIEGERVNTAKDEYKIAKKKNIQKHTISLIIIPLDIQYHSILIKKNGENPIVYGKILITKLRKLTKLDRNIKLLKKNIQVLMKLDDNGLLKLEL